MADSAQMLTWASSASADAPAGTIHHWLMGDDDDAYPLVYDRVGTADLEMLGMNALSFTFDAPEQWETRYRPWLTKLAVLSMASAKAGHRRQVTCLPM